MAGGFFASASHRPERTVLVDAAGGLVRAGDLLSGMDGVARGLHQLGLRPPDTVAVVLTNRPEFLECYGAAIQTGLCFVAVNWHLGPSEIAYILEDSKSRVVVTEGRFASTVHRAAEEIGLDPSRVFGVDGGGVRSYAQLRAGELGVGPAEEPSFHRSAGQIMFYTSGTTGRPKGVRKSFRPVAGDEVTLTSGIGPIRWGAQGSGESSGPPISDEVHLASGPLYHALPIAGVVRTLDDGGQVVMMDRWAPETFLDRVQRYRVSSATLVPTMFHRLLALPDQDRRDADVSSLRSVQHAGAPCPVEVKRRMIEWWGPIITESYSSTEGAGTSVTSEEWLRKPGTVGRPSPGVVIKILDEDGNECPPGAQGLVYLTPLLWDFEYHHDSDKTTASRRDGMFTVGDIGYLDEDGYLFLCDRQADVIISGGVNIYPAEVEAVLLQHRAVRDVAVIGVPNDEWGEEVRAVVELDAVALAGPDTATELIEFCRSRIAGYKCPKAVDFVESLERDPNGKLRKAAIRARYWPEDRRRI